MILEGFPLGKIIKQNTLLDLIVEFALGISNPFLQKSCAARKFSNRFYLSPIKKELEKEKEIKTARLQRKTLRAARSH